MKKCYSLFAGCLLASGLAAQCSVSVQPYYDCMQTCSGFANATATGASPFNYAWSNGDTGSQADSLCHDSTYVVTMTDNNGCVATDTVIMLSGFHYTTSVVTNTSCMTCCDGSDTVYATPSNNCGPLMYQWYYADQFPSPNNYRTNLCYGTYTVTVTDQCGCVGAWTCTVGYNTTTGVDENAANGPNVTQNGNLVTVQADGNMEQVQLVDLQGRILFIRENAGNKIEVPLDNYPAGSYFISTVIDGKKTTRLVQKTE